MLSARAIPEKMPGSYHGSDSGEWNKWTNVGLMLLKLKKGVIVHTCVPIPISGKDPSEPTQL